MGTSVDKQSESTGDPSVLITRHTGRYLVATYYLWARHDRRIRTGELSDRLAVKPATVTEMFDKLDQASLIDYEKQHGAKLTDDGQQLAQSLAWQQCVVRTFFAECVDTELTAEDAYRIGYTLSEEGFARLRELVDHPCESACQKAEVSFEHCRLNA